MAIKGQKYNQYPESIKREAMRLHVEEHWSRKKVATHLEINEDRVKKWARKLRRQGEELYIDRRGNPHKAETEETRKVRRLEMEVDVLKKWLEILNKEVR